LEANAIITDLYTLVKTSGGLSQGALGIVGAWGKFLAEYNRYTSVFSEGVTIDTVAKARSYVAEIKDVLNSFIRGISQGTVLDKVNDLLTRAEMKLMQANTLLHRSL